MLRQTIILLTLISLIFGQTTDTTAADTTATGSGSSFSTASTTTLSPDPTASTTTRNPNATVPSATVPTTTISIPANLQNCSEVQEWFISQNITLKNGYFPIVDPFGAGPRINFFCDFTTDGGHWTAIQVRTEDEQGFEFKNQNHSNYVDGFLYNTVVPGSYWIGLNRIKSLLDAGNTNLRIDMFTCGGVVFSAVYNNFTIGHADLGYILTSAEYDSSSSSIPQSSAGDSLYSNNPQYNLIGRPFYAADNYTGAYGTYNCAQLFGGGWWFNKCGLSNLNGIHYPGCYYSALFADGIRWGSQWSGYYSPNRVEIKLRSPSNTPVRTTAAPPATGGATAAAEATTAAETVATAAG